MDKKQNGHQQDPLDLVNQYEEQIREWAKGKQQSSPMAMDILEKCISDATNLANRFYGVQELEGVYPSIPPSNDFAEILDQAIQLKNQNIRIRMLSWIEVYSTAQLEQLKAAAELVDMIIDDCRSNRKVHPLESIDGRIPSYIYSFTDKAKKEILTLPFEDIDLQNFNAFLSGAPVAKITFAMDQVDIVRIFYWLKYTNNLKLQGISLQNFLSTNFCYKKKGKKIDVGYKPTGLAKQISDIDSAYTSRNKKSFYSVFSNTRNTYPNLFF